MRSERGPLLVDAGLCLFAASLPLSVAGANLGWALAAAGMLLCVYERRPVPWRAWKGPLAWPIIAYLAAALLASLCAEDVRRALGQFHKDAHKLWIYALLAVAFRMRPPGRVLRAFLLGAAIAALIGIAQWALGVADWVLASSPSGPLPRAHAFVHPVTFGELMAFAFLGCVTAAASDTPDDPFPRRFYGSLAGVTGLALLLSNTRGAIVGVLAGFFALAAITPALRRRLWAATAAILALAVLADLSWPNRSFILTVIRGYEPTNQATQSQYARLTLWKVALQMVKDHPLTGVGVGCYREALPRYVRALFDGGVDTVGNAHNLYLHHLAERGLAGFLALAWLLWTYLSVPVRKASAQRTAPLLWSVAAAAAFLVINMTEVALQIEVVWMTALLVWTAAEA